MMVEIHQYWVAMVTEQHWPKGLREAQFMKYIIIDFPEGALINNEVWTNSLGK